jgi:GNAT superfamily N-acetyltransferase
MLAVAADWRSPTPRPVREVLADPLLAHYVTGWPRPGDGGVVAEDDGGPLGAAWWRTFPPDDPGFGFVRAEVPEVSVAVRAPARGRGVGRALLRRLIAEAERAALPGLSLSVEADNPARRLYLDLGFDVVAEAGALTMLLDLPPAADRRRGTSGPPG